MADLFRLPDPCGAGVGVVAVVELELSFDLGFWEDWYASTFPELDVFGGLRGLFIPTLCGKPACDEEAAVIGAMEEDDDDVTFVRGILEGG